MGNFINCLGCGRDTTAISGYCARCIGHKRVGGHDLTQIDDRKDRPVLTVDGDHTMQLMPFVNDINEIQFGY